jgi:3-hydroxyisobutyrate dehydrogenase-like beta-hydroxyacid dehydrogenase
LAVVALLHPGAMGARVGGELVAAGHQVRWLPAGRSDATAARAGLEGLTASTDPAALVAGADVVLSLLPPQAAVEVAAVVAGTGFTGTYVDANPVSPGTLATVQRVVEAAGATLVDAGVVGPPPRDESRTHLYLAGEPDRVAQVETLVAGTRVAAVVVGPRVGQASAAKQAYALHNKGRMVLSALAGALAEANGVAHVLAGEADRPGAELLGELGELREGLAEVGWRWGPELDELALAVEAAGLDPAAVRGLAAELRREAR